MSSGVKYSHTLWSPSDTVKDVAEVLGIQNLPDEVAKTLAMDIEYRIHEIVEQAVKFMRHGKRQTLTTKDISNALKVLHVEPLYGYESARPLQFREAMVGPGQTLYYLEDEDEVDFEKYINQPLPKVPRATSFTAHWLAIEGVQPAIPQNPTPGEIKAVPTQISGAQQSHSIAAAAANDVEVKPLVKHVISKELQLYFDQIVAALVSDSSPEAERLKNSALGSLRNDPGLHQLVPYFVQFVQEKVAQNLRSSAAILKSMLDVVDALLHNEHIFVQPYIHQIMPSVLTVLLAKHVGPADFPDDSYELRQMAASLLKYLVDKYGDEYQILRPRAARTVLKAFMTPNRPLGSLYGAVAGLQALGPEVVRVFLLGNLKPWAAGVFKRVSEPIDDKMLTSGVVSALRLLKTQAPENPDVSTVDNAAFEARVGPEVASRVLQESDGREIAYAVLFGELPQGA